MVRQWYDAKESKAHQALARTLFRKLKSGMHLLQHNHTILDLHKDSLFHKVHYEMPIANDGHTMPFFCKYLKKSCKCWHTDDHTDCPRCDRFPYSRAYGKFCIPDLTISNIKQEPTIIIEVIHNHEIADPALDIYSKIPSLKALVRCNTTLVDKYGWTILCDMLLWDKAIVNYVELYNGFKWKGIYSPD